GRWDDGKADAGAMLTLARHVGGDPIILCALVGYSIEEMAVELVAPYVPELKAPFPAVEAAYQSLQAHATMRLAVLGEKSTFATWIIRQLREAERRKTGSWREVWNGILDGPENAKVAQKAETVEQAIRMIEDLLPVYDQLAKVVALPQE